MPSYLLFCRSEAGSEVFRAIDEYESSELENLVADINEQLSEMGISVQAVNESDMRAADRGRWQAERRQLDEWSFQLAKFTAGIYAELPEVYPARYEAWQSSEYSLQLILDARNSGRRPPATSAAHTAIFIPDPRNQEDIEGDDKVDWCDEFPPEQNSRYQFGPVEGTVTAVAGALRIDPKTLKNHNGTHYYARRVHSRRIEVWFDSQLKFDQVRKHLSPVADA